MSVIFGAYCRPVEACIAIAYFARLRTNAAGASCSGARRPGPAGRPEDRRIRSGSGFTFTQRTVTRKPRYRVTPAARPSRRRGSSSTGCGPPPTGGPPGRRTSPSSRPRTSPRAHGRSRRRPRAPPDDRVDLLGRTDVVGERQPPQPPESSTAAVLRELARGPRARRPCRRPGRRRRRPRGSAASSSPAPHKRPRAGQVADAKCDQADALLHALTLDPRPAERTSRGPRARRGDGGSGTEDTTCAR